MAKEFSFTPAALDAAICVRILDPATPGLLIEALPSGRKRWQFRRRLPGTKTVVKVNLGSFPAYSIADAREWAAKLNAQVEAGIDPREVAREERTRTVMTVARAHELYMVAVREGRSSRAKRPNKPRTISDKLEIYQRDIAPRLAHKIIYDVTEPDLVRLVNDKGKVARSGQIALLPSLRCSLVRCAVPRWGLRSIRPVGLVICVSPKPPGRAS